MKSKILFFILPILIVLFSLFVILYIENNNIENYEDTESNIESNYSTINEESFEEVDSNDIKGIVNINSYQELLDYTKKEETSIVVLVQTGCHYCELFEPVLENAINKYDIEIAKIDFRKITSDEYKNIVNGEILMPAKCSKSGVDSLLSTGFGTPSTLFIKNSKSYDCIRGYKNQDVFESELKKLNLIN